jgi:hypothetical protein
MGGANQKGRLDNEGKRKAIQNFLEIYDSRDKFIFFTMIAHEYFERENFPEDLFRPILEQFNKILVAEGGIKDYNKSLLSQEKKEKLSELWELNPTLPRKFSYSQLASLRVIEDSEIPVTQQHKVTFEWKQIGFDEFNIKGISIDKNQELGIGIRHPDMYN